MTLTRAVGLAFLLSLGGCLATTNPESPGETGNLYEDLPAAEGMKLEKPPYGHASPSGTVRDYQYFYSGTRKLETVKAFYEGALPKHDWKHVSSEGSDPAVLTFEKRAERVVVTLKNAGDLLKVHVHVRGK